MNKGHILVVDDEKNILSSLKGILYDEGFEVSIAENGSQALRIIEDDFPDIVMLDIWIPGMDGIQTLKAIKKLNADIDVIMMSGHGSIETAVKATKMGAFDFIEKPLSMENIISVINNAFDKRRNIPPLYSRVTKKSEKIIGKSKEIQEVRKSCRLASRNSKNVFIRGVKGSGKKFLAMIIHQTSQKKRMPIVIIDCKNLITANKSESKQELQGDLNNNSISKEIFYKKLEQTNGGTIILDGIENLSSEGQEVLFDVIKKKSFKYNYSKQNVQLHLRYISTLNIDIKKFQKRNFKKNLYALLTGFIIYIPSIQERNGTKELINHMIEVFSEEYGKQIKGIKGDALKFLSSYNWKDDVKDLKNSIEQMIIMEKTSKLTLGTVLSILSADKEKNYTILTEGTDAYKITLKELGLGTSTTRIDTKKIAAKSKHVGELQRTLKRSVVLCGHGLHSGLKTGLILTPLPPNSGIMFGDISSGETVPAHIKYVQSTQYATTLKKDSVSVKTIEHIMAALHMYNITNLLIKMGDEVPIMDGSAVDFCQLIEDGAIEEQNELLNEIVIDKKITVEEEGKKISIEPSSFFHVSYHLDYRKPVGVQKFDFKNRGPKWFKDEIAPARTFGFLKDYEKLEEMGLASGGKLSNIILVDDEKVINTPLRFPDEFVRHKILDIIGDFYLMGMPIRGKIKAVMTGHSENIKLVKKIHKHFAMK